MIQMQKRIAERVLVFSFSATVFTLIYSSQRLETLASLNKSPNSIFLYAGFKEVTVLQIHS